MDLLSKVLEIGSVAFNLVFIILLIKERKSCWVFGILGSLTGALLFHRQLLFSESFLYLFYAGIGIYGWYVWNKNSGKEFKIVELNMKTHIFLILIGIISFLTIGFVMSQTRADKAYYDALSTSFSIIATFLEIYKVLSAWIFWIGINIFSIWLYGVKELWIYATLMALYAALSIYGYQQWKLKVNHSR